VSWVDCPQSGPGPRGPGSGPDPKGRSEGPGQRSLARTSVEGARASYGLARTLGSVWVRTWTGPIFFAKVMFFFKCPYHKKSKKKNFQIFAKQTKTKQFFFRPSMPIATNVTTQAQIFFAISSNPIPYNKINTPSGLVKAIAQLLQYGLLFVSGFRIKRLHMIRRGFVLLLNDLERSERHFMVLCGML